MELTVFIKLIIMKNNKIYKILNREEILIINQTEETIIELIILKTFIEKLTE